MRNSSYCILMSEYYLTQSFRPSHGFGSHPSSPDLPRTGHSVPRDTLNIPIKTRPVFPLRTFPTSIDKEFPFLDIGDHAEFLKLQIDSPWKSSRHLPTDFGRKTKDFSDFSLISTTFAGDCIGEAICFRTRPISAEWPGAGDVWHQTRPWRND